MSSENNAPLTERQNDLEIYIKQIPVEQLVQWIQSFMAIRSKNQPTRTTYKLTGKINNRDATILIHEEAAGKAFTTVWLTNNVTDWPTDLEFARAARNALGAEIRCSVGDWKEGESLDENWWILNDQGESISPWN